MKQGLLIITCLGLLASNPAIADKAKSLDELVQQVRKERTLENKENLEREKRFAAAKSKQAELVRNAKTEYQKEERRSQRLRTQYEDNERQIKLQNSTLKNKTGDLDELHGVVRQLASDVHSLIDTSIISAQKPDRSEAIEKLMASKELPSIKELENLWLLVLDEMAESSKVVNFESTVISNTGEEIKQDVLRVGSFNVLSNGHYLRYLPETKRLVEPGRQPSSRFQSMASDLQQANAGVHPLAIDPTRGSMLALLVQVPDIKERVKQGGLVGYIIIGVAVIGLLLVLERFVFLQRTGSKVQKQLKSKKATNNPLGRIMKVYDENPDVDTETLEYKLDEAILKELPRLQRGLNVVALLAAIAPLLGLLGTVTGIIETFQSITLFGTGDPRTMSEGISQALVTTVMGLVVAIPLLLFHSFLSGKSNQVIQILDEKSKSFVALLAELNRLKNAQM